MTRKIVTALMLVPLTILFVSFAVANRQTIVVSLDPFELVRDDNLDLWPSALEHVNAFFPSEDEMLLGGDAEAMLRRIAGKRLRLIALKRGIRGGELLDLHGGRRDDAGTLGQPDEARTCAPRRAWNQGAG